MNLLKCARCGFVFVVFGEDPSKPCPFCGGLFFLLDESEKEDPILKTLREVQKIREPPVR